MFINSKNIPQRESCLKELDSFKKELIEFIIENIYTYKKKKIENLTFDILIDRFDNIKYYFTAGFIREQAFIYSRDYRNKENKNK